MSNVNERDAMNITSIGSKTISEILESERARIARMKRLTPTQNVVAKTELAFASIEDRAGAALLRTVMGQLEIIHHDDEETIMRLIVPNAVVSKLEMWGADTIDHEEGHDREAPLA